MAAPTLTQAQLAASLGVVYTSPDARDPTAVEADVNRVHAAALALIAGTGHDAPATVANEALVRLAGYLYDLEPGAGTGGRNPLRDSGALALLAPYRSQGLAIAAPGESGPGASAPAPGPAPGGGIDRDAVELLIEAELVGYSTTIQMNAAIMAAINRAQLSPGQGSGLTPAQAASLLRLNTFEAGMKRSTALVSAARLAIAVGGAAQRFPSPRPVLPPKPHPPFGAGLTETPYHTHVTSR